MYVSNHPNAELLEQMYGAFARPDGFEETMAMLGRMMSPDFVIHCGGASPVAGDFLGLDGMKQHVADFFERSGGTFHIEQDAIVADDHWALVSQRANAAVRGLTLDQPVAGIWRFAGPGILAEHWELASDIAAWDAFWAGTTKASA
jgi:hypothetical protein